MQTIFSSLLTQLGTYIPKSFALASFVPTLAFAFLNICVVLIFSKDVRDAILPQVATLSSSFYYVLFVVGVAIIAYFLAGATTYLREILEGRHLWPPLLLQWRRRTYSRTALALEHQRRTNLELRGTLAKHVESWRQQLNEARDAGHAANPGKVVYPPFRNSARLGNTFVGLFQTAAPARNEAAQLARDAQTAIEGLRGAVADRSEVTTSKLEAAVAKMIAVLDFNDPVAVGADAKTLTEDYRFLLTAFDYASTYYALAEVAAFHERQFSFGQSIIAPTRVGNLSGSVQSYADTRYGIDLDFFWGRIQSIALADAKYADTLLAAKTQLDFFVLTFWLAAGSTIAWTAYLSVVGRSVVQFLAIFGTGSALVLIAYELVTLSYVAFADAVRVTIDFYRFDLLKKLHVATPGSKLTERRLWDRLAQSSAYGLSELDVGYSP